MGGEGGREGEREREGESKHKQLVCVCKHKQFPNTNSDGSPGRVPSKTANKTTRKTGSKSWVDGGHGTSLEVCQVLTHKFH